jgi:hypothetical protein
MSNAGYELLAGRIPGERIATTIATADSSTFTTESAALMTVAADLVSGRTYRVRVMAYWNSSVAADVVSTRIREDTSAGTQLLLGQVYIATITAQRGYPICAEVEYTAVATATKTFVVTGQRFTGSGNGNLEASTDRPAYLYVDYIRG